ncbi:hypothetical protein ACFYL6_20070 [Micromonospora sp. NPDC007208]
MRGGDSPTGAAPDTEGTRRAAVSPVDAPTLLAVAVPTLQPVEVQG